MNEALSTWLAASGTAAVGPGESLLPYAIFFLLVSFAVAVVTSAIRLRDPRQIVREGARLFVTIVVGIFVFSLVVFALEWLFVRPLL